MFCNVGCGPHDTAYSVETLDAVTPLVVQENEIIYLFGQDLLEKTQMACIDPYYGGLWKAEILHQAEKSPVSAYTLDKICVI